MLIIAVIFSVFTTPAQAECIPARTVVEHRHGGQYHRVHPSGNYVLYSAGNVQIADFTDRSNVKTITTPMRAETYPVESASGGWELLASPYDSGGMNYYQFKDIQTKQRATTAVYKDPQHDQYYHSSAELPGSTKDVKKIRTLLYGKSSRDYTMSKDENGNFTKVEAAPKVNICTAFVGDSNAALDLTLNAEDAAKKQEAEAKIAPLDAKIAEIEQRFYAADRRRNNLSYNSPERRQADAEVETIRAEYMIPYNERQVIQVQINAFRYGSKYYALFMKKKELDAQVNTGMPNFTQEQRNQAYRETETLAREMSRYTSGNDSYFGNPVLSKDGTLVAAIDRTNGIAVYKILPEGKCQIIGNTGYSGSKVSFSHPEPGKLPKITFTAESGPSGGNGSGAYVYDLETKASTYIGTRGEPARYPGFTLDGRVIYSTGEKFVIVDPNQAGGSTANCIQKVAAKSGSEGEAEKAAGSAE